MQQLEAARDAHGQRAWADAYELFIAADRHAALDCDDLERLATAAYLLGHEDEAFAAFERAHATHVLRSERTHAARCAFWLGLLLMLRGEAGRASGWLVRARRLVDEAGDDCVERGYLLIPVAERQLAERDWTAAYATATDAQAIGVRFGDIDLTACARHLQGRALLFDGKIERGLALLDEVMLAATGGQLSPILAGLVYCSVIDACLQMFAFSRAREWTAVLSNWCASQPQMVAFTGTCVVHRAQVLQLSGGWQDAMAEVRDACDRFERGIGQRPPGGAYYEQAELHRLRGELDAAEEAYRNASQLRCDPQPGLALLRLAEGRSDDAVASMRRVVNATTDALQRSRLLPAYVEVLLACGDSSGAREACKELQAIARSFPTDALVAISAQAQAAVELAEPDPARAVVSARRAWQLWEQIEAPYLSARARELIGLACGALGDADGQRLELEAARTTYEQLGAALDLARIQPLLDARRGSATRSVSGLTARELEVLRLVAAGKTNRAIAGELHVSEKTIERHVSNIFLKLGVATRAAATAYAYQHHLV